jgi:hypothetical protein
MAGIDEVFWMTTRTAALSRGISLVPRAWVVDQDLRLFGVAADTAAARLAVEACVAARRTRTGVSAP